MWSSWNQALQARCCVRACAVALMMMSLKDTLPWSPSCLFRASRASLARSMSTSVVRKKWGMGPREVASRFAMVLRICVNGTSSYGLPLGAGCGMRDAGCDSTTAEAAAGASARDAEPSTSRLTTRPPGPDPLTSLRSTPASRAIRLASGEAFTRVRSAGAGSTPPASRIPLPDGAGAGRGAAAGGALTVSPGEAMMATTLPTATVWPSAAATCRSTPSARATRSITALSVSTSASVSPVFTGSPSRLWPAFLDHDRAAGVRDRADDRLLVERAQRSQVQHFRRRALALGQLLGGLECHRDRLRVADERDIAPRPLDVRAADRDEVLAFRHLTLEVVQHLALEHDHGVVVPDRRLQEALRVRRRRGGHDLQPRDVGQPGVPRL